MLNITSRQILILGNLLSQEFTRIDSLTKKLKISHNTCIGEIKEINIAFQDANIFFHVKNHHSQGYRIESTIPFDTQQHAYIQKLLNHCISYSSLSVNQRFMGNRRVLWLIRYFLQLEDSAKAIDIAQKLHISLATLNKDLRIVRNIFSAYNIEIQSIPYKGMQVVGPPCAIRSCMIDTCDLYNYEERDVLPQTFLDDFHISHYQFNESIEHLKQHIHQHKLYLTSLGFYRILLYVLLYKNQNFTTHSDNNSNELLIPVDQEILEFSKCVLGKQCSSIELNYFSTFVLCNMDYASIKQSYIPYKDFPIHQVLTTIENGVKAISGLDLHSWDNLDGFLHKFIYQHLLKRHYKILDFSYPKEQKIRFRKQIASYSLANYIFYFLSTEEERKQAHSYSFFDLIASIDAIAHDAQNEYLPMRFGITSKIGYNGYKVIGSRLLSSLPVHQIQSIEILNIHQYQLDELDSYNLDALVVDESIEIDSNNIDIPIFVTNDATIQTSLSRESIWNKVVSKKRKIRIFDPYREDAVIINVETQEIPIEERIMNTFYDYGLAIDDPVTFKEILHQQIYDGLYGKQEEIKIINLFTDQEIQKRYFVFNLFEPIQIGNNHIGMINFLFSDSRYGLIIIKNGDSELRRYFNVL